MSAIPINLIHNTFMSGWGWRGLAPSRLRLQIDAWVKDLIVNSMITMIVCTVITTFGGYYHNDWWCHDYICGYYHDYILQWFVVTTMITIPMIYMIYTVITITIPIIIISMITIVSIMAINLTRSVERALNQRRRALKLLQKETKRHSGAKVLLQIYIFLFHSEAKVSTKPFSDNETLFTRRQHS